MKRKPKVKRKPKKIKCFSAYPSKGRCAPCKTLGYCIALGER